MASPFIVKVLDASGNAVGNAPLTTVTALNDTRVLDGIGRLDFDFPAGDPITQQINEGSQFDVYDPIDGYLGRYLYKNDGLRESVRLGSVTCHAYDMTRELTRFITGFRRQYLFNPLEDVVSNIVSLAPGWTSKADSGVGNTTVTFEGESILRAVDILRDRWGLHYRLTPVRTLEFGAFGANSGVVVSNLTGQLQPMINARNYIAAVDTITRSRDGDWIVNAVIALGGGQGINQVTMEGATAGDYALLTGANGDSTLYYYIADAASIALYGFRPHVVAFTQINPLSNNVTDILRAKNAVKLTAEAYLRKHKSPNTQYSVTVEALRTDVKPGDKVRLTYRGANFKGAYLDVDEDFYVTEITRKRDARGNRSAALTISTLAERRTSDADVIVDVMHDVKALKVYYQPTQFRQSFTYTDDVSAVAGGDGSYIGGLSGTKPAVFKLLIDNSITQLNKVIIRFVTYNQRQVSDVSNIPAVNEHFWSENVSKYFPKNIHLIINDVDVSSQFGGPWNVIGQDVSVDVSCDITSLIKNAAGGVYQLHKIYVTCNTFVFDDVKVNSGHPAFNGDTSFGIVEMNIRIEGSSIGITQV